MRSNDHIHHTGINPGSFVAGLLLVMLVMVAGCDMDEPLNPAHMREFRINLNQGTLDRNVYLFDMISLQQEGFLAFGICNNNQMTSLFDGDGSIYFMKLDKEGVFEWDTCYNRTDRGFPSNVVVRGEDEFLFVWNSFDQNRDLEIIGIRMDASRSIFSEQVPGLSEAGEVFRVIPNNEQEGFFMLGLESTPDQDHFVNITEVGSGFALNRVVTRRFFIPQKLGGFGLSDILFMERIGRHLGLLLYGPGNDPLSRLVFNAPQDSLMAFSNAGEIIPQYSDETYWISSAVSSTLNEGTYVTIVSDVKNIGGRTFFYEGIDFNGPPENFGPGFLIGNGLELDQIDPDYRVSVLSFEGFPGIYMVGGTTGAGQVRLFIVEGDYIRSSTIGGQIPLEFVAMAPMQNGKVLITGHTVIANESQKPFTFISDPVLFDQ